MRVVAAHGASLGPTRFTVGCARQTANLDGILLYRFRSKLLQRHRLPVDETGIATVAGGAPGLQRSSTILTVAGYWLPTGKEATIYPVGARAGTVLGVERSSAAVPAIIYGSSYCTLRVPFHYPYEKISSGPTAGHRRAIFPMCQDFGARARAQGQLRPKKRRNSASREPGRGGRLDVAPGAHHGTALQCRAKGTGNSARYRF